MKANELMIGDKVIYTPEHDCTGYPVTITDIAQHSAIHYDGDNYVDADENDYYPIPLTPEILEKNGFVCKGAWVIDGEDLGLRQCGDEWAILSYYADYNGIPFCRIAYVHELQHALRLCGIDKEITI